MTGDKVGRVYKQSEPIPASRFWIVGWDMNEETRLVADGVETDLSAFVGAEEEVTAEMSMMEVTDVTLEEVYLSSETAPFSYDGPVEWNDGPPDEDDSFLRDQQMKRQHGAGFYGIRLGDAADYRRRLVYRLALNLYHQSLTYTLSPMMYATGRVSLLGEVVEHTQGYRAEGLRIDGIVVFVPTGVGYHTGVSNPWNWPKDYEEVKDRLSERYRCPVRMIPFTWPSAQMRSNLPLPNHYMPGREHMMDPTAPAPKQFMNKLDIHSIPSWLYNKNEQPS